MKYQGSCHCGKVAFEVEGEIDSGLSCNCSICRRKGSLLWFTTPDRFRLLTPDADAATYLFNRHVIRHRFCAACGIHPFGQGKGPGGQDMVAINIRCIEGLDLEQVPVKHFDGRAL